MRAGTRVKLKDYSGYSDYRLHKGQIGVLETKQIIGGNFGWRLKWADGGMSSVNEDNLIETKVEFGSFMLDKYGDANG